MLTWGKSGDKPKQELSRKLEIANVNLADSLELIAQIFDPRAAKILENRVYRIQEQIRELKGLVKQ